MRSTGSSRREPASPASANTSANRAGTTRLYHTRNDLPEATRREVIALLNQRLANEIVIRVGSPLRVDG